MFKITGSMVLALGCVVIGVGENSSIFAHVSGDKRRSKNNANLEPDMGNPTVGLVYYTSTLHYNCSFKSSLPYITTLL